VVLDDKIPVGIVFLPIESVNGKKQVSIAQGFVPCPMFLDVPRKTKQFIFEKIEEIAIQEKLSKIMFFIDPLDALCRNFRYNFLLDFEYIDASSLDCVVFLDSDTSKMWREVRRRYKPFVNRVLESRDFELLMIDVNNASYEIHSTYVSLHHKAAGRITRPLETFEIQYRMLQEDKASISCLKLNGKIVCALYFLHFGKGVVYMSGADDPEYDHLPLYHATLWNAIVYYAKRGFKFMRLSEPATYAYHFYHYPDKKQKNIAFFKRGFGKPIVFFKGIKYYSKEDFESDLKVFKKKILEILKNEINRKEGP
jgi:hypothetical protein